MNMRERDFDLRLNALTVQMQYMQMLNDTGSISDEAYRIQADNIIVKATDLRADYDNPPKNRYKTTSIRQLIIDYNKRLS